MRNSDGDEIAETKLDRSSGGGAQSADESGGRSTGYITGFTGGSIDFGGGGSGGGGTVIKGRYNTTGNRGAVKNSVRYYETRENERGKPMEREGFSRDSDALPREEINGLIDRADEERNYEYRMVISPGTDRDSENIDLREHTREVMAEYQSHVGPTDWVAFEHGGEGAHTERAHVHAVMYTDRPLTTEALDQIRDFSSERWAEARELERDLDRHQTIDRNEFPDREQQQERSQTHDRLETTRASETGTKDVQGDDKSEDSSGSSEERERKRGRDR